VAAAPLFRLWDRDDLGWRRGFRATFAWLCAWTVPMIPISWWGYGTEPIALVVSIVISLLGVVAFMRMGHGRWFQSRFVGVIKALALMIVVYVASTIGGVAVIGIGVLGASIGP